MDTHVIELSTLIKQTEDKAVEIEFNGGDSSPLWKKAASYRERRRNGEVYEILF